MQTNECLELSLLVQGAMAFTQQVIEEFRDRVGDRELEVHLKGDRSHAVALVYMTDKLTRARTNGAQALPIARPKNARLSATFRVLGKFTDHSVRRQLEG